MDPKKRQALKDKATKGMKFTHEGMSYGLYKGSGKAGGAMKDYLLPVVRKKQILVNNQKLVLQNQLMFQLTNLKRK